MNYLIGGLIVLAGILIGYILYLRKQEAEDSIYIGHIKNDADKNENAVLSEFDEKINGIKKVELNNNEDVVKYLTNSKY